MKHAAAAASLLTLPIMHLLPLLLLIDHDQYLILIMISQILLILQGGMILCGVMARVDHTTAKIRSCIAVGSGLFLEGTLNQLNNWTK